MSTKETEMEVPKEGLSKPDHGGATVTLSAPLEELIPIATRESLANAPALQDTVEVMGPDGKPRILAKGSFDESASARAMKAGRALIEQQKERQRRQSSQLEYNADVISYVECKRCMGPGIWMHGDPFSMRTDETWESTYHMRGSYWSPNEAPFCQMCHSESGNKVPLRVFRVTRGPVGEQQSIGFMPNQRFVRSLTMTQYKQLVGEPAKETQNV